MPDHAHMTSLFENATEGIILTGNDGKIVLVNPATERIFGFNNDELIGQPIEILIPEQVKHHHHTLREGFYQNPSNRVMGQGRDLYGRKKDGSNIPVEVSLSHYKKKDELFVIAFIVDITRRKDSERNMVEQQKQLEKVMLNAAHIRGSIEGIAGADAVNLSLQDEDDALLLEYILTVTTGLFFVFFVMLTLKAAFLF